MFGFSTEGTADRLDHPTAAMATSGALVDPSSRKRDSLSSRWEICIVLILAIAARALFWSVHPPDMGIYLEPWFAHIVRFGPIGAFARPFSNYEPAYLYLLGLGSLAHGMLPTITIIKLISVAGTFFLMTALAALLSSGGISWRGALFLLILPSVAINDSLLGQCDAFWAGSCIFGLAAIIRGKTARAMCWCGLAIGFKAQAAFIAPVMIGVMAARRAPWWQWLIPGAVFLGTLAPAWLAGWPAMKLLTVYVGQANFDQIPARLANPWIVGTIFAKDASRSFFVVGYFAAGYAAVVLTFLAARAARDPKMLVLLAAISGTALPFLLPKMLERYYFLGDVMTLALALTVTAREASLAVRSVQLASILSQLTYLYVIDPPFLSLLGAICAAVGLLAMCRLTASGFVSRGLIHVQETSLARSSLEATLGGRC
jgi:Gpi18-like mannosyltransferase